MSWIKIANKLGRYIETLHGFRLYCTEEPTSIETVIETQIINEFEVGKYIAINKKGEILESRNDAGRQELLHRITMFEYARRLNK